MGAHCSIAGAIKFFCVGAWGVTEPTTKLPGEMSIVAKAAGVGDLAERLVRSRRRLFLVERRCHRAILQ
jgi:hypothetical protein